MSGTGGADQRAQRFAHDILKQVDLSPSEKVGLLRNGLANLLAWVLERTPDTGVPPRVIRGRPNPFGMVPVRYAAGGGTGPRGAPETLGMAPTITHVERADAPAAYPLISLTEAKLLKNLSTPIIQLERSADALIIARASGWHRLIRVVGDTACMALIDAANDPWNVAFERGPGDFLKRPQTDVEIWAYEVTGGGEGEGGPVETPIAPGSRQDRTTTPTPGPIDTGRVESGLGGPGEAQE